MTGKKEYMIIFSHIGYGAKGLVYIIMGILSVETVIGISSGSKGAKETLQEIGSQPMGNILLLLLSAGLICYVIWRIFHAVSDPDNEGSGFYGIIQRTGFFISALMHAGLVYLALKLVFSAFGGSGRLSEQATATVMTFPLGRIIVALVGAGVIGSGLYEIYFALAGKYKDLLNLTKMKKSEIKSVSVVAKAGLSLRGIIFAVIGVLFIKAALNYDPNEAGGLRQALDEVSKQPFGQILLGAISAGFILYGIYIMTLIKYRELNSHES